MLVRALSRFAFCLTLACFMASCGVTPAAHRTPNTLHLVRSSQNPSFRYPPLDITVTNQEVAKLYAVIQSLPHDPPGDVACPADLGLRYHLTLLYDSTIALDSQVQAQGCAGIALSGDWRRLTDSFWSQLAITSGIPVSDLLPAKVPAHT